MTIALVILAILIICAAAFWRLTVTRSAGAPTDRSHLDAADHFEDRK